MTDGLKVPRPNFRSSWNETFVIIPAFTYSETPSIWDLKSRIQLFRPWHNLYYNTITCGHNSWNCIHLLIYLSRHALAVNPRQFSSLKISSTYKKFDLSNFFKCKSFQKQTCSWVLSKQNFRIENLFIGEFRKLLALIERRNRFKTTVVIIEIVITYSKLAVKILTVN